MCEDFLPIMGWLKYQILDLFIGKLIQTRHLLVVQMPQYSNYRYHESVLLMQILYPLILFLLSADMIDSILYWEHQNVGDCSRNCYTDLFQSKASTKFTLLKKCIHLQ